MNDIDTIDTSWMNWEWDQLLIEFHILYGDVCEYHMNSVRLKKDKPKHETGSGSFFITSNWEIKQFLGQYFGSCSATGHMQTMAILICNLLCICRQTNSRVKCRNCGKKNEFRELHNYKNENKYTVLYNSQLQKRKKNINIIMETKKKKTKLHNVQQLEAKVQWQNNKNIILI